MTTPHPTLTPATAALLTRRPAPPTATDRFNLRARELMAATLIRPALTSQAETAAILARFPASAEAALKMLEDLADGRLAWLAMDEGGQPHRTLTPVQAENARAFFTKYGRATATPAPTVAPAAVPALAVPAIAATAQPAAAVAVGPTPTPATLAIHFVSAEGWPMTLTIPSTASTQELSKLMAFAEPAAKALASRGAKPTPAPTASAPAVAGAQAQAAPAPTCPTHGTAMRENKYKWFCPREGDGPNGFCEHEVRKPRGKGRK